MRITLPVGENFKQIVGTTADDFAAYLRRSCESDCTELVLDFKDVESMSSMAMGAIFSNFQALRDQGKGLAIINASERIQRLLRMVNMANLLKPS